jgi:hypothetical protein
MESINDWIIVGQVIPINELIGMGFQQHHISFLSAMYSNAKPIDYYTKFQEEDHKFSGVAAAFYGYKEQEAIAEDKKIDLLVKLTSKAGNQEIAEHKDRTDLLASMYTISVYNNFKRIPENLCISLRVFSIDEKSDLNFEEDNSALLSSSILKKVSIIYHPTKFTAFILYDHIQYDKVEHYYLRHFKSNPTPDNLYSANYYLKKYANLLLNGYSESLSSCKSTLSEHLTKLEGPNIEPKYQTILNGEEDATALNASKIVESVIDKVKNLKNALNYKDYIVSSNTAKKICSKCGKALDDKTICFENNGNIICINDIYAQLASNKSQTNESKEFMVCLQVLEPSLIIQ